MSHFEITNSELLSGRFTERDAFYNRQAQTVWDEFTSADYSACEDAAIGLLKYKHKLPPYCRARCTLILSALPGPPNEDREPSFRTIKCVHHALQLYEDMLEAVPKEKLLKCPSLQEQMALMEVGGDSTDDTESTEYESMGSADEGGNGDVTMTGDGEPGNGQHSEVDSLAQEDPEGRMEVSNTAQVEDKQHDKQME